MTLSKTWTRDLPNGSRVVATGRLGDHFSITGEVYEKHGTWSGAAQQRNGRESDIGGAIHEEILKAMPELAPLVAVHLCAPDGTPMHARANGWYFYSGAAAQYRDDYNPGGLSDLERAARALHIPPADLPEGMDEAEFNAFVDTLQERWAEAARIARELLES